MYMNFNDYVYGVRGKKLGRGLEEGTPKSPSHFTFQKNKKQKMIPIYSCFRPQGLAILW
jgi:hypothetical protein